MSLRFPVFLLLLVIVPQFAFSQPPALQRVREQFLGMDATGKDALSLYVSLKKYDLSKSPVLLAYRGACSAASAGAVSGVWDKLSYFNQGKDELEKAVRLDPQDPEIRFLRLATQLNAPSFLGYSGDVSTDKSFLLKKLTSIPGDSPNAYLYVRICRFMLAQAKPDATARRILEQNILKFNTDH
jgi:hypothetical protein